VLGGGRTLRHGAAEDAQSAAGDAAKPGAADTATPADAAGPGADPPRRSSSRHSRHVPNPVKREVVARDGFRCAFVDEEGRRCRETRFLEFHHRRPWGKGGGHTADNLELRCRTHNQHAARLDYGPAHMEACMRGAAARANGGRGPEPRDGLIAFSRGSDPAGICRSAIGPA